MQRDKSEYSIQTVVNAVRILEAFEGQSDVGVSELSRRLGLHKNNVFRVLATLEGRNYVEQLAGAERYRLGPRCQFLGRIFRESHGNIGAEAPPYVQELADRLGETAHVAVRHGRSVRHLYGAPGAARIGASVRVGDAVPAHCTALGKVLLASAPPAVMKKLDRELGEQKLTRHTDSTIVDREKYMEHLRGVAARGFALDQGEWDEELSCAAVPVFDGDDLVVGALSVSGPRYRFDQDALEGRVLPILEEVAGRLSRALGAIE